VRNRFTRCLAALLMVPLMAGCWDRREVNEVNIVSVMAIDRDERGKVRVTLQFAHPRGAEVPPAQRVLNTFATGETLYQAVQNFPHVTSRETGLRHNNVIVFSEELAREGLGPALDLLERHWESRLDQWLLIARGGPAGPIASAYFPTEPNMGNGLRRNTIQAWRSSGQSVATRLYDFFVTLSTTTTAPVAAVVSTIRPEEAAPGTERVRIGGAAVFKGDRLRGFLTEEEARGLLWLQGRFRRGTVLIPCMEPVGSQSAIAVHGSKTRLVPHWQPGRQPVIRAKLGVTVRIQELTCLEAIITESQQADMEQRIAAQVERDIATTLKRLQGELAVDPIGIGEALHRAYPRQWPAWEKRWEAVFPTVRVVPEIRVTLLQTGVTKGRSLLDRISGPASR
jgi:spore germination protein KC